MILAKRLGSSGEISVQPHLASFATRRSANLDGFGIDTEIILKTVHSLSYLLADFLHQTTKELPSVVVLAAGDKNWEEMTSDSAN